MSLFIVYCVLSVIMCLSVAKFINIPKYCYYCVDTISLENFSSKISISLEEPYTTKELQNEIKTYENVADEPDNYLSRGYYLNVAINCTLKYNSSKADVVMDQNQRVNQIGVLPQLHICYIVRSLSKVDPFTHDILTLSVLRAPSDRAGQPMTYAMIDSREHYEPGCWTNFTVPFVPEKLNGQVRPNHLRIDFNCTGSFRVLVDHISINYPRRKSRTKRNQFLWDYYYKFEQSVKKTVRLTTLKKIKKHPRPLGRLTRSTTPRWTRLNIKTLSAMSNVAILVLLVSIALGIILFTCLL